MGVPQLCIRAPSLSPHPSDAPSAPQDAAYHCTAALFYLSASVLEALATITMQDGFTYRHYHENIAAVVSPGTRGCVHSGRLHGWQGVCVEAAQALCFQLTNFGVRSNLAFIPGAGKPRRKGVSCRAQDSA